MADDSGGLFTSLTLVRLDSLSFHLDSFSGLTLSLSSGHAATLLFRSRPFESAFCTTKSLRLKHETTKIAKTRGSCFSWHIHLASILPFPLHHPPNHPPHSLHSHYPSPSLPFPSLRSSRFFLPLHHGIPVANAKRPTPPQPTPRTPAQRQRTSTTSPQPAYRPPLSNPS